MRAILIDPSNMTITEVEYNGDWKTIAPTIAAQSGLIDAVYPARNLSVFVDDEGLLYDGGNPHGYFQLRGPHMDIAVLAGKGLMLGFSPDGESTACNVSLGTVKSWVRWMVPKHVQYDKDTAIQEQANDL